MQVEHDMIVEEGIRFLEGKGVFSDEPFIGDAHFTLLRNPSLTKSDKEKNKYAQIRCRLANLVSVQEEVHSDHVAEGVHQYSDREFPGYDKNNVFFLKHPDALCQRYQKSGLCYMHGPATVQHYALTVNGHEAPMIDLLKFVRDQFTPEQLEKHVFANEGGDSHQFLKSILQPNSALESNFGLVSGEALATLFDKHGPGLVSQFKVYDCFHKRSSVHKHYGKPEGNYVGLHAMTLVGHRKDEKKGLYFFLLQNWWKGKQFVEVDEVYLRECEAQFHFVATVQTEIPQPFASSYGKFYELELLDKAEGHAFEM